MDSDGRQAEVATVRLVVCLTALMCLLLATIKEPRTRQESRFHHFYARMRDDEFRRTFRTPRALFDSLVDVLRPELEYR
jgi:hypothetical protein